MKRRNNSAWEEKPSNLKEGSKANKEFISYIVKKSLQGFSFHWDGKHEEYKAPRSNEWFLVSEQKHHWEF